MLIPTPTLITAPSNPANAVARQNLTTCTSPECLKYCKGQSWSPDAVSRTPHIESIREAARRGNDLVSTAHRNCPKIVAADGPAGKKLIGGQESGGRGAFHEGDRKVATDAVSRENQPVVRRGDLGPQMPRAGIDQRAVVADQPLFVDDVGIGGLRVDPAQFGPKRLP